MDIKEKVYSLPDYLRSPLLESCVDIIQERKELDMDNSYYINESIKEIKRISKSLYDEVVVIIGEAYKSLLKFLDTYVLNDLTYLTKYIDLIEKCDKQKLKHIVYESYTYKNFDSLPRRVQQHIDFVPHILDHSLSSNTFNNLSMKFYREELNNVIDSKFTHKPSSREATELFKKKLMGEPIEDTYKFEYVLEATKIFNDYKIIKSDIVKERETALSEMRKLIARLEGFETYVRSREFVPTNTDNENNIRIMEKIMIANMYYTELYDMVKNFYIIKSSVHKNRYLNNQRFVSKVLRESSTFTEVSRKINVQVNEKRKHEIRKERDEQIIRRVREKEISYMSSSDPDANIKDKK